MKTNVNENLEPSFKLQESLFFRIGLKFNVCEIRLNKKKKKKWYKVETISYISSIRNRISFVISVKSR